MGSPQRILVVAGARALSRTVAARLWSLREKGRLDTKGKLIGQWPADLQVREFPAVAHG